MRAPFLWSLLFAGGLAAPQAASSTSSASASACTGNTANDRSTWCDYDLQTDWYTEVPDTGVTVEYWFEVTNTTVSPDGIERIGLAVNGSIPGPTIEANWGDTVVVHVLNSMQNNGTGIHWHGIRQNWTNWMDGVPSITQCPIAPGESMTYTWRATQYGSSWYHSHFSLQAWNGVFGPIVIHGPASANYDEDIGPVMLSDWSHQTADELYTYAQTQGPPELNNALINGLNVYNNSGTITGSRWETTVTSGNSYRLRLVNTAIDTHFKFMIDNHTLTVIAMDFVPIEPYETEYLDINMGQRYDVIVSANQDEGDYWIRAIPQTACSANDNVDNIRAILRYDSSSTADPTTTAYSNMTNECVDEPYASLVPALAQNPTSLVETDSSDMPVTIGVLNNLFKWYISAKTMAVEWGNPTTLSVYGGKTDWTDNDHVVELATANEWVYFVIETAQGVPHPFHLHGHDFWVLAAGTGTYSDAVTLNTANPPRRDVATLPASGYVVIAFYTDNPGAW
ncbi:putative multicopper oxidase protein [Lasiodiplodia theobromae]|uniref:Multicopper oxidase protein n=1 Tax=Lasiodiplodia theobromae TaxID=45133 RepID=A0A8H7IPX4_9PEZI|nr:Multicopper oxidase [Lasiodiplodia theobromae]KAF4543877.1 Multicopper oxidase [Lasiodiplodia theobromae]KAF9629350.1 putative multicopper oxidase protein [Lasiodiplodia theobromae]